MAKKKEEDDIEEILPDDVDEASIPGFGLPREELVRRRDNAIAAIQPVVMVECNHTHDCWCSLGALLKRYSEALRVYEASLARWEVAHKKWKIVKAGPPPLNKDGTEKVLREPTKPVKPTKPTKSEECAHRGPHQQGDLCEIDFCTGGPTQAYACVPVKGKT
jgi:hypothetical protein